MKSVSYFGILLLAVTLVACESDDNGPRSEICDILAEVNGSRFDSADDTNYTIESASITGDCLTVELQSGGCDGSEWEIRFFASDAVNESLPPQQSATIVLDNDEPCDAIVNREFTIELTPLQIPNESSLIIRLSGWDGILEYEF